MKKIGIILCILAGIVLLSVFSTFLFERELDIVLDEPMYRILEEEGQYFLQFERNFFYYHLRNNVGIQKYIAFDSIKNMLNAIRFDELDYKTLVTAYEYWGNKQSKLPICDLDHIYEPILPNDYSVTSVYWTGLSYEYSINCNTMYASAYILHKEDYQKKLSDLDALYFNEDTKAFTMTQNDGVSLYSYAVGKFPASLLHYSIETDTHELEIYEVYNVVCKNATELESEIPYMVYIFGMQDQQYFQFAVGGFAEHPSYELLSQFGIREYVETVTE